MLFPFCYEYEFERRTEYRAAVQDTCKPGADVDRCTHRHRTHAAALRCAKRLLAAEITRTAQDSKNRIRWG